MLFDKYDKQRFKRNYYAYLYKLRIGHLRVWFSFNTPIAFWHPELGENNIKVADDYWKNWTTFHCNQLQPDKDKRVPREYLDFYIRKYVKQEIDDAMFPWGPLSEDNADSFAIQGRGQEWFGELAE